ncbi:ribosome biogenesis protein Nop16 [Infundibulicybe gibba]|nr:ribosome biogenesis protein Nop16 [Infundibulicybe gibba]
MANPRQRRKMKSSSHRAVSHSKNAKRNLKKMPPIRGPKVLQDAWNKHKTVRQNYVTLGLVHNLNPSASEPEAPRSGSLTLDNIPRGYGKIIRDESGSVIRIEIADEDEEDLSPGVDEHILGKWATHLGGENIDQHPSRVVLALEEISSTNQKSRTTLSAAISGAGPRHASGGEVEYLERLIKKYGQDVEKMARDPKLNPEQRTAGELRRSLKRTGLGRS